LRYQPLGMAQRILIVEDEALVAIMVQDMLEELGFTVVGPAGTVESALALLAATPLDGAVLDCNLGNEKVWPVADVLRDRQVPFVFSTGYGVNGIDARFQGVPVLAKPYDTQNLRVVLKRLLPQ
jgi:CheY-like chemotaxis protein